MSCLVLDVAMGEGVWYRFLNIEIFVLVWNMGWIWCVRRLAGIVGGFTCL
jgi:hypothetical protein